MVSSDRKGGYPESLQWTFIDNTDPHGIVWSQGRMDFGIKWLLLHIFNALLNYPRSALVIRVYTVTYDMINDKHRTIMRTGFMPLVTREATVFFFFFFFFFFTSRPLSSLVRQATIKNRLLSSCARNWTRSLSWMEQTNFDRVASRESESVPPHPPPPSPPHTPNAKANQCRPWSDATFCGVWSGSTLFAIVPFMGR